MSAVSGLVERYVEDGTVPGAVGLVGPLGGEPEVVAAGNLTPDAIVRIQSMTKAVTAVAALRLVEAGEIGLDSSVTTWLPELSDRQVLVDPYGPLSETVPADRNITLRDLLTCGSGYGMIIAPSPLQQAMAANGTEAGPEPVAYGASEWLAKLAELPLAFQPGQGWRYHHSFGILGVLLSRLTGGELGAHLARELFGPLGMIDTAYWVAADKLDRLPAAYAYRDGALVEVEPAGGGFYAGPPPYDVSHAELVSTARDYFSFLTALWSGELINSEHLMLMTSDQISSGQKTADAFFPGFFDTGSWGYGVGVTTVGDRAGRWSWSGGQGTTFYVTPSGEAAILLTQVEMGERVFPMLEELDHVAD